MASPRPSSCRSSRARRFTRAGYVLERFQGGEGPASPSAASGTSELFRGRWRLVETDLWDVDEFEAIEQAHITFGGNHLGEFVLVPMEADLDYQVSTRDGHPLVEFTWDGHDEGDPINGRGWARIDGDSLVGEIYIHRGDHSGFVAHREEK